MRIKYILLIQVMFFFVLTATAQQGINYKAIIHDASGIAIANTSVTVQFTILENGTTNIYQETHNITTDNNGIIIVNIGEGTVTGGDYHTINWGNNPHFLKTELDTGDGLTEIGTSEFKSVPYALYAKTAEIAIIDEVVDADSDPANELQSLTLIDNTLSISEGGSVILPIGTSGKGQYYYADQDDDGYGNIYNPVYVPTGESEPAGFILDNTDCNDENGDVNPGAIEIVDGIDNNCNGQIDE